MKKALFTCLAALGAVAGTTLAVEGDAQACGGCFHPPEENPTVVTDHRMLLSVSKDQTTLYDQIKYQGAPSSFAWVLPIAGTVDVGLSAEATFRALDGMTQTRIVSPPQNCPAPPSDCQGKNSAFGSSSPAPQDSAGAAEDGGVAVLDEKTIGPYETVQLASTDPTALTNWLNSHGYNITPDVKPIVDAYVAEHFNFLALKLVPGSGVQDMRPVRVTTKGASVALPLRMVSAGTGATVGITLWVVGEGRYEPQNFPSFHIDTNDIAWDWNQQRSNYTDLRAKQEQTLGGKGWEIECSIALNSQSIRGQIYEGYYEPVKNADGTVQKTAEQVLEDDFAAMFHGLTNARVTRMRGDIAHAALNKDLVMIASGDQAELPNVRQVTKELNEPLCPVYQNCQQVGTAPRSQAATGGGNVTGHGESFSCNTTGEQGGNDASSAMLLGLGFVGTALVRARRKSR